MVLDPAFHLARQSALASIGAVVLTRDELTRLFDRLATRGEQIEQSTRQRFRKSIRSARHHITEGEDQLKSAQTTMISGRDRLFDALQIPTSESIEELQVQVARLMVEIENLARPQQKALPVPNYDKLNAESVIERLPKLDVPALLDVRTYEQTHANRITVLRAVERALVLRQTLDHESLPPTFHTAVEPLPRYNELRAEELGTRLAGLSEAELLHVQTYEQEHQARSAVLVAIERQLAAKHESQSATTDLPS